MDDARAHEPTRASYALNLIAGQFANSKQPFVPERIVLLGGNGDGQNAGEVGIFQSILKVLTAWQTISAEPEPPKPASDKLTA